MLKNNLRGASIAVSLALLIAISPGNAFAGQGAEDVADTVSRIAPKQGEILSDFAKSAAGFSNEVGEIPLDPSHDISVSPRSVGGQQAELRLPVNLDLKNGVLANDGTIVYDGDVDVAVQTLDDKSVRIQTVIPNANAKHEFEYSLGEDNTVMKSDDGEFFIFSFAEDGEFDQYQVNEPWARDARGKMVPTHFELRDGNLVQIVETNPSTKYPVVADPRWKWWGAGWGAKMNKSETKDVADQGTAAGLCVLLGGGVGAPVCAAMLSHVVQSAKNAVRSGNCVFAQVVPLPMGFQYNDSDCF